MIWIIVLIVVVVGLSALVIWMALSRPSSSIQASTSLPLVKATAELSMEHGMLVSMLTGQQVDWGFLFSYNYAIIYISLFDAY